LEIALTDGGGTVTQDPTGANNSFTKNLTGSTTSYAPLSMVFRTPVANPSTGYRLRVRLSTALDNTKTLYLASLAMAPGTQLYIGGPYAAIFSGATDFLVGDKFTWTIANNYSSKWQVLAEKFFGMRALGLQLPSSVSPTINDSLIS
jgi:hypothetical protein